VRQAYRENSPIQVAPGSYTNIDTEADIFRNIVLSLTAIDTTVTTLLFSYNFKRTTVKVIINNDDVQFIFICKLCF